MTEEREKVVLITGATGSVGESLVAGFTGEGYRVFFLYYRSEIQGAHAGGNIWGHTDTSRSVSADRSGE